MRIEGTIAATVAASNHLLSTENAVGTGGRERVNQDTSRQQAMASTDATAIAEEQRAVGPKLLSSAVESVERLLGEMEESVALRIHKDGKRVVVRVVDRQTGKVTREIPADRFLDMVDTFEKQIAGLFVDEKQ